MEKGWQTREEAMGTKRKGWGALSRQNRADRWDAEQMGPHSKYGLAGLSAPPNNLKPHKKREEEAE